MVGAKQPLTEPYKRQKQYDVLSRENYSINLTARGLTVQELLRSTVSYNLYVDLWYMSRGARAYFRGFRLSERLFLEICRDSKPL